jgi:probable phosphoglycerate mutase
MSGTRVVLWRHGNTDWNATHRVQGQSDVPLNDLGRRQAAQAAECLARREPDLLISSDLQRAAHTADALAEITGLRPERDARLRERAFGQWEALTAEEIKERLPQSRARWEAGDPDPGDGVEPLGDLAKRVAEVVREVADRLPGGLIVLASHGGSIKYGVASLLGWPEEILPTLASIGNCHWTEVTFDHRRGWRLVTYNAF